MRQVEICRKLGIGLRVPFGFSTAILAYFMGAWSYRFPSIGSLGIHRLDYSSSR